MVCRLIELMEFSSTARRKEERRRIKVVTEKDHDVFCTRNIRGLGTRTVKSWLLKEEGSHVGLHRQTRTFRSLWFSSTVGVTVRAATVFVAQRFRSTMDRRRHHTFKIVGDRNITTAIDISISIDCEMHERHSSEEI